MTLADEQSLNEALKNVVRTHMERTVKIIKAVPLGERPPREPRAPREQKGPREPRKPREQKSGEKIERKERKPRENKPRTEKTETGERAEGERRPRGGRPQSTRKVSYTRRNNDECSIYVGNLSFRTTEMNLGRHFEKYGDIKNVKIIEDRETQKSKGFGYVEFEDKESVEKALAGNGSELEGR